MSQSDWPRALDIILASEGGYVNDPADPGGATNHGITQRTLDRYRRAHDDVDFPADVKDLASDHAAAIYSDDYWMPSGAPELPWPISLVVFDTAVNQGLDDAKLLLIVLQKMVGVRPDGILGPITKQAVERANRDHLFNELCWWRVARYASIARRNEGVNPARAKFLRFWITRILNLRREAL